MFRVFLCVARQHDAWLVAVASLVCVPAAIATFFLYSHAPAFPRWRRWAGMTMTGLVAGSGIWTTHFVAMLAFKTGLPTGFDPAATAASFAIAVVSATLGFSFASRSNEPESLLRAGLGGGMVGAGVTVVHYVGMAGYRSTAR
jgi:NO-binding membrane sensor protein with MHYT domain